MSLWSLLFPPRCPFCRRLLEKGEAQPCLNCRKTLPWTGERQRVHGSFFGVCVSPLHYRDSARAALLRYKFGRKTAYAACFSRLMADCAEKRLVGGYDVVTWVPLSRRGLRKRGFCQSELLARGAAAQLGVPCAPMLRKPRHTPAQSGIADAAVRRANVSGAFSLREDAMPEGKRVLLVDDVVTTGATLSECSRLLLMGGAEKADCLTLCCAARMKE